MNEEYRELIEQLRRQHAMNRNEVYGKGKLNGNPYTTIEERQALETPVGFRLAFKLKVLILLVSIMLFSLYIYGGQDIRNGADLAWKECQLTIQKLEEEEPVVKETITYCKKGYDILKDAVDKMEITE